jgi:putative acyl-CoA dehydrogenase
VTSRATHEVVNQPPPLVGVDRFSADDALVEAVRRHGGEHALGDLAELGRRAGSAETRQLATMANTYPPTLRTHDRYGRRVDEVEFHPAWHELMTVAIGHGLAGDPWRPDASPAAHLVRAAGLYVWSQAEAGHACPVSMTYAAVPALRADPQLAAFWEPRLTAPRYQPGLSPPAEKTGCLAGMAMTEKQGGSDVRAGTTRATPLAGPGEYALTGHKWFCSAPMSDVFLVLAQAPDGLTCFVLPRVLPDGGRNQFAIQRLKDKLGNRSNASAEVEFDQSWALRLGPEGRGVATIMEMVALTRLDCVTSSAALMRAAVSEAVHHARHRAAFGRPLIDAPLMRAVLADLALEAEAAAVLAMWLAAAVDAGERAAPLLRLALPVAKFWVTKRASGVSAEALECLGGNGYVEDSGMPRLYREAPVNAIWEGSGNVQALDVCRVLRREPDALSALLAEVGQAHGADPRLDAAVRGVLTELGDVAELEAGARRLVERLALVLQGSLLVRFAPPAVADAFCAARLGSGGVSFGALPAGLDLAPLLARAAPTPPAS